ncbi:Uncharacterised protein [Bordetella pertussis]|nr:Uncharacterised protein [Bordetella pertussis]
MARAWRPISASRSGCSSISRNTAAMAGTSRTGTTQPSRPAVMFSGSPPALLASTGLPSAIISRQANDRASRYDST